MKPQKPDPRTRGITAGAFWGTLFGLAQAAFAADPFHRLTVHTITMTITLTIIYLVIGRIYAKEVERARQCQSN